MGLNLKLVREEVVLLDPDTNFKPRQLAVEKRFDPLTGDVSRVVSFKKFQLPVIDWSQTVQDSLQKPCPFCRENLAHLTPQFPGDLIAQGRLPVGRATVVPNLAPYDRYSAVVVMTPDHYVSLAEISFDLVNDSFRAAVLFLQKCAAKDAAGAAYMSANWNYMPYSGGTLVHPHLQVLAGPAPGNYHRRCLAGAASFARQTGSDFWAELVNYEQAEGLRYLGQTGQVHWLATFAPRALGDVTAVLPARKLDELSCDVIADLTGGIINLVLFFQAVNIASFNAALFVSNQAVPGAQVFFRLAARFPLIYPAGSDMSYLQVMHADPWTVWPPEYVCSLAQKFFQPR